MPPFLSRPVASLSQDHPGFRQADFLQGLVEDAIVKEGLMGLGVVALAGGVAGLLAVGVVALLGGKRR